MGQSLPLGKTVGIVLVARLTRRGGPSARGQPQTGLGSREPEPTLPPRQGKGEAVPGGGGPRRPRKETLPTVPSPEAAAEEGRGDPCESPGGQTSSTPPEVCGGNL